MSDKIVVVGAGAIGSSVAADLTDAGQDVTIIDQWPAHVDKMRADGLRINMPDLELQVAVDAHHICDLASLRPTFDIAMVCVKSFDTRWAAQLIEPYLAPDGVLVGIQNSMNDDAHGAIVGRERTVGCAIELSADIYDPGVVTRNTTRSGTWLTVGELDNSTTPRLEMLAELLSAVAVTEVSTNIYGSKWTKLVANSMAMGPFGLLGLRNWEAAALPGMREISVMLGRESVAVGRALGYELQPVFGLSAEEFSGGTDEVLYKAMDTLNAHVGSEAVTATVQDYWKGRRSEYEFITGLVVDKGVEVGLPTPANSAVFEIYRQIDSGDLELTPTNLDRLQKLLSAPS
ncbi:MAG: ketopantoate reductase family protein [Acidimicrobiales bacterium]